MEGDTFLTWAPPPLPRPVHKGMRQRWGRQGTDTHTAAKTNQRHGVVILLTPLHGQAAPHQAPLRVPNDSSARGIWLRIDTLQHKVVKNRVVVLFGKKGRKQRIEGGEEMTVFVKGYDLTRPVRLISIDVNNSHACIVGVHGWWLTQHFED